MALNTKTIKRRIKSIGNTKKITKAMEMISAVKMRRAVANVLASRNYAHLAWEMLKQIASKTNVNKHPLLQKRKVKRIGMILVTSNRGLAGGFGSRMLQSANQFLTDQTKKNGAEAQVILTGKQGKKMYHRYGHTVVAEFDKIDLTTKIEEVLPIAQLAIQEYMNGTYDSIVLAYTDFVSAISQVPTVKQILPLKESEVVPEAQDADSEDEYLFEPNTEEVLNVLLPRLVEMQIYQAILESDASEHSARMMAMRNASDAATDMIKELTYSFNKARQAAITQEIAEVVGGAAALG